MTAKTVTMPVIVASGLAMLGAPDAGADVTSPLQALVDAAAQRLQTADPVAASKFRTGGQVDDPQREQQVIDAVTADAALAHIDAGYVHDVFRNQIDATDSLEHSRFAQWKLDPASAPGPPPTCRRQGPPSTRSIHHRRRDRQTMVHTAFTVVPCRPRRRSRRRGTGKESRPRLPPGPGLRNTLLLPVEHTRITGSMSANARSGCPQRALRWPTSIPAASQVRR
jgi:chorismate mutase-like protein